MSVSTFHTDTMQSVIKSPVADIHKVHKCLVKNIDDHSKDTKVNYVNDTPSTTLSDSDVVLSKNEQLNKFKPKEICYYNMINKFYKHCDTSYIIKMIDIINGDSDISLRILDWFVTRYSNRKKIVIPVGDEVIDVHISYKAQLKSYKKKYFDPFKRRAKFEYKFKVVQKEICTTLGQLNFFRWAIENSIIDYVEKSYDAITHEMNISNKNDKKRKKEKSIEQLVVPQNKGITKNNIIGINVTKQIVPQEDFKIILTFD